MAAFWLRCNFEFQESKMNKKTIITSLFTLVAMAGLAQTSFGSEEGCLNVVDVS